MIRVGVTGKAFSTNTLLVKALSEKYPNPKLNLTGKAFSEDQTVDFLEDCDAAIVALEKVDDALLKRLPNLRFVSKFGVGLDNIDLDACKRHGVKVGWRAGVNKFSVAEITLAFMLMLSRNLYLTARLLDHGEWFKNGGQTLSGKTIGIIGLGNIGQCLVALLKPFGCKVLATDIQNRSNFANEQGVSMVTLDDILEQADIVTLHVPSTPLTTRMVNRQFFRKMRNNAILINTSRGDIVVESDLIDAINAREIAGAALDVFEHEPVTNQELLSLNNVICTPHIGGNSEEAVLAMGEASIDELVRIVDGGDSIICPEEL